MIRRPPRATRTDTLLPNTTRFRSHVIFLSSRGKRTHVRLPRYDSLARHALRVNACRPSHIYERSLSLAAFRARTCSRAMCRTIASAMRVKAASTAGGARAEGLSFAAVSGRGRCPLSFFLPAHPGGADFVFPIGRASCRGSVVLYGENLGF